MNTILWIITILATAIGFFAIGFIWQYATIMKWRRKWIELEHELARLQNREPRDIEDV